MSNALAFRPKIGSHLVRNTSTLGHHVHGTPRAANRMEFSEQYLTFRPKTESNLVQTILRFLDQKEEVI